MFPRLKTIYYVFCSRYEIQQFYCISMNQNKQQRIALLKQELQNQTYEAILTHKDRRLPVQDSEMNQLPYSLIGYIRFNIRSGSKIEIGYCTGFLIDEDLVLTVGHAKFYGEAGNVRQSELQVFYITNQQKKGQSYNIVDQIYLQEFRDAKMNAIMTESDAQLEKINKIRNTRDFMVLKLDRKVERQEYFEFLPPDCFDKTSEISVYGYPQQKLTFDSNGNPLIQMFYMSSKDYKLDKGVFQYNIDTTGGQSGSPILFKFNGKYYVCGIHTGFIRKFSLNKGIYIHQQIVNIIEKFKKSLKEKGLNLQQKTRNQEEGLTFCWDVSLKYAENYWITQSGTKAQRMTPFSKMPDQLVSQTPLSFGKSTFLFTLIKYGNELTGLTFGIIKEKRRSQQTSGMWVKKGTSQQGSIGYYSYCKSKSGLISINGQTQGHQKNSTDKYFVPEGGTLLMEVDTANGYIIFTNFSTNQSDYFDLDEEKLGDEPLYVFISMYYPNDCVKVQQIS